MIRVLFIDRNERWKNINPQSDGIRCYKQITEYDPNCSDNDNDLAKAIFAASPQKWDKKYDSRLHCVDNFNIVILHMSNRWAEKFFKLRCKGKYTVLFSGALTVSDNFRDDMDAMDLFDQAKSNGMCYFVSETELINNLGDFLSEWSQQLVSDRLSPPSFDVLKHGSHGSRIVKAHRLRYEILSPLVALDLINQVEENNKAIKIDKNLKNQVKTAISDLTQNGENGKKNPIDALCDHIQCESFRGKLENLVSDGSSSLKIDRNDLEDIAKSMEEQIARL